MRKKILVPDAQNDLDTMKMEVASELGLDFDANVANAYQGNISTKNAELMAKMGNVNSVGGEMVKRMITQAEKELLAREKTKKQ